MKFFPFLAIATLLSTNFIWETDFDKATQKAKQEHKLILLKFSGSDWCLPCIKMQKEVFESPAFINYADSNLVLVNADFPRLKKNKQPEELSKRNEKLAEKYNKKGTFPLTLILDENGKVLKSWDSYPKITPEQFTALIKELANARR
jgi:thioredoxin-related protein